MRSPEGLIAFAGTFTARALRPALLSALAGGTGMRTALFRARHGVALFLRFLLRALLRTLNLILLLSLFGALLFLLLLFRPLLLHLRLLLRTLLRPCRRSQHQGSRLRPP